VWDDLGVGLAGELVPEALEFGLDLREVLDDPVVDDRDPAVAVAPVQSTCGCAFASVGRPCVAQRVWPMPSLPLGMFSFSLAIRRSTLASLLVMLVRRPPSAASMTATPAES